MKKILVLLTAIAMSLGLSAQSTPVKANEEATGIIYYNVMKLTIADAQNLTQGGYFMSTDGGLTDATYMSAKFPDNLEANVMVTNTLDTSKGYYGKDEGSNPYGIDGYPVTVIKRDHLFDGCNEGHLFAPADKKGANGEQLWIYYCNFGGAQNIGPYYLYSVQSDTYTAKDVAVKVIKDFSKSNTAQVVTKDDIEVTINVTMDGKVVPFVTKDFEIDEYYNTVDPLTGKSDIQIILEGAEEYTNLNINVSIPVTPKKEEPKAIVAPVVTSPKTGFAMPLIGAVGVSIAAIGSCSVLGKRKHK